MMHRAEQKPQRFKSVRQNVSGPNQETHSFLLVTTIRQSPDSMSL
jgi:hypothetical protein